MNTTDSFDRRLAAWLDEDAEGRVHDHLGEVLVVSRATVQRSRWSSLERWLSVDIPLQLRSFPAPRLAWLLVVLALVFAVGAAVLVVGMRPRVPAPFGPAANGMIVYGDGDIVAFDPATGTSRPLVAGSTVDTHPFFSRDGSHFAFLRSAAGSRSQFFLAAADGTVIRALTQPIVAEWADWSPDGTHLVVADSSASTFSIVPIDGSRPQVIDLGLHADRVFWRPGGMDLVFRGTEDPDLGPWGLYLVNADGTGLRPILPELNRQTLFQEPALSPDGTRVMYSEWTDAGVAHLYTVSVADGNVVGLIVDGVDGGIWSDYFPSFSPDGTSIVFNRGRPQESYHLAVVPAGGGSEVRLGTDRPWEAGAIAAFSPDGSQVIARYDDGSTWIYDPADGSGEPLGVVTTPSLMTWQRVLAP
jgi:dipeptidyl aminopeptidase/acylaminoacyl peptidase